MKVLVLGGTGFLGSNVVRAFVEAGHDVAVTVRPRSRRTLLGDLDIEIVPADLLDLRSLDEACRGRDWVVHSAGLLSLWEKHARRLYRINVLGTRNVVNACLEAGVKRLIHTGSVGIYAGSTLPEPVDEDGTSTVERFHSFHVISMALGEAEVLKGIARGLDAVRLHPALCLGEGDRNHHSSWAIMGIAFSRLPFTPPGGLNLVDVRDVARAHLLAAEKAPRGANYLVGGENLTNRAFADMLRDVFGIRTPLLPLPRSGIRILGDLAELTARLRGADEGENVTLNHALGQAMSLYWFVDDSRIRREIGYESSPVRPALERQIGWLNEQGLLPESGLGLRKFASHFFGRSSMPTGE